MGKKSGPESPDPKDTSAAQTGTNVATAVANAYLGNVNKFTPDGSLVNSVSGTRKFYYPYTGKTYDIPTFTQRVTLSPAQQRIKQAQDAASFNLSDLARQQSGFLKGYMSKPFSYDTNDHEKWALGLYDKLSKDDNTENLETLQSKLSNMGISLGSPAYDRAMAGYDKSRSRARDQFLLDSYKTGFGSAQALRSQPINEITALMSGGQVTNPQFPSSNMPTIPTTDNAGIIQQDYQNRLARWQQGQAAWGSALSGIGGLFGMLSDRRAKTGIKKEGKFLDERGFNLYSYRYKGEPKEAPRRFGFMAQEVEKKVPSAVMTGPDGLKRVDYGRAIAFGA